MSAIDDPEVRQFLADLAAMRDRREDHSRTCGDAYEVAGRNGRLKERRVIDYRCARGCLLLDVINWPQPYGVTFHKPRHKKSDELNRATSNEAGRANNTEDGNRRWKALVIPPECMLNVYLDCDHLSQVAVAKERIADDIRARRRHVTITASDHDPRVREGFEAS